MKVERQRPKEQFVPIVITLETEEEANYLWHRLNIADTDSFDNYRQRKHIDFSVGFSFGMWTELNKVFRPEGEED